MRPSPLEYIEHIKDLDLVTCCHINNTDTLKKKKSNGQLSNTKRPERPRKKIEVDDGIFYSLVKKNNKQINKPSQHLAKSRALSRR